MAKVDKLTRTGGKLVVEALCEENVKHVFGLIGSAGMEIFDSLYDEQKIKFIGVRDERTGTHMADGYARASGSAGVILAGQNGPGVTNLVTGLAQASAAFSPVIALAGSLSSEHQYRDAFQEVDQFSLLKPVTKKTYLVPSTARIPELVRDSFRTAMSPKRGPVALNIPRDVLSQSVDNSEFFSPLGRELDVLCGPSAKAIDAVVRLIKQAKAPLILAGGGVKNGRYGGALERLSSILNAPLATSPGHGDAVSASFENYAGQVGPRGNVVATELMQTADLILAIGTRIGFNATFFSYDNINRHAKIIQVELDPLSIGRFFPVEMGILADAGVFADSLIDALTDYKPSAAVTRWVKQFKVKRKTLLQERDAVQVTKGFIQPDALFKAIRGVCPTDSAFTLDAGTLCLQATDKLNYHVTPSLFSPLDFGLVGFSYACGLGVKIAMPDRPVISLMGDGGFGMTSSELGTAAQYNIATICVVMNNGCWGAEKAYQRDFFNQRYLGSDVPNPRYDKLAELWGVRGYRVDTISQFEQAMANALSENKPAVLDVMVDPDALYSFRRDSFKNRTKG